MRPLALLLPPASPTHRLLHFVLAAGLLSAPLSAPRRSRYSSVFGRWRPLGFASLETAYRYERPPHPHLLLISPVLSSRLLSQEAALEFGSRTALYCTASDFVLFVFVRRRPRRRQQPIRRRTMRPPSQPSQRTARPKRQSRPPTPPPPLSRTRRPPSNARPAAASPIASCASRSQTFASRILSSLLFSLVSRASSVG